MCIALYMLLTVRALPLDASLAVEIGSQIVHNKIIKCNFVMYSLVLVVGDGG